MPDTSNTLRADLDALEHTNVAVRSMFRTILDGVRDHPTTDPARGEDLRLVFAALLGDVAAAVQAFGDLARAEGTDTVGATEDALTAALATLREARDRIDDLQMIDTGSGDGGWELSEPVRQTVERVLRDLDLAGQSRRRPVPTPPVHRVDPFEIIKSAHQLLHSGTRPEKAGRGRRSPDRREIGADQTGPHRLPLGRGTGSSTTTGRGPGGIAPDRSGEHPAGAPLLIPGRLTGAAYPAHEDAERVPGRVGEHEQRLLLVVGAIQQLPRAQGPAPADAGAQIVDRRHRGVQMQHLRSRALRPGRLRQTRHLLEGQAEPAARDVAEHQPVLAVRVRLVPRAGGSSPGR